MERFEPKPVRFRLATVESDSVAPAVYTCCSKECLFPVVVGAEDVTGSVFSHGVFGICLNAATPHRQRYCNEPCGRFVCDQHFARTDPSRGHQPGHKKRHPGSRPSYLPKDELLEKLSSRLNTTSAAVNGSLEERILALSVMEALPEFHDSPCSHASPCAEDIAAFPHSSIVPGPPELILPSPVTLPSLPFQMVFPTILPIERLESVLVSCLSALDHPDRFVLTMPSLSSTGKPIPPFPVITNVSTVPDVDIPSSFGSGGVLSMPTTQRRFPSHARVADVLAFAPSGATTRVHISSQGADGSELVSTSAPLLSFPGNATLGSIVLQLSEAHHLPDDATVVGVQASAIPCSSPLPPSDHAFVFILSSSSKRRSPSACACNSLNTLLHSMMTDVSGLTVLVDPTDSELASAVDESKSTVYITDCCGQRCKQAGTPTSTSCRCPSHTCVRYLQTLPSSAGRHCLGIVGIGCNSHQVVQAMPASREFTLAATSAADANSTPGVCSILHQALFMQGFITQSFKSDNPVDWYHTGHAFSSFGIGVFGYPFGVWSQNCSSASLAPFMMWTSKGVVAHRSSPVPSPVSDALLNAFRTSVSLSLRCGSEGCSSLCSGSIAVEACSPDVLELDCMVPCVCPCGHQTDIPMSCLPSLRHSSHTEPVSNTCTCVKPGTGPVTVQDIRSVTTALTAVISGDAGECGEVFADAVTPVAFLDVLAAAAFTADPVTSPRQECTDWSTETVESAMSARTMAMPVRPSILRGPSSPHAATPLPSYFATKPAFRDRGDSVGSHSGSCSTAVTADQSGSELLLSLRGKRKSTGNIPEPIERSSSPADSSEDEESVDEEPPESSASRRLFPPSSRSTRLSSKQCAALLQDLCWDSGQSRWNPRLRKGGCYHCGAFDGEVSLRISRNLCDECRHDEFTPSNAGLTDNPYAVQGYRFCQGNCSTVPRPLNEFTSNDAKKCKFCCDRKKKARHRSYKH